MMEIVKGLDKKADDLVNGNAWHIYNPMTEHVFNNNNNDYVPKEIYTLVHEHNRCPSIVISFDEVVVKRDEDAIDLSNDYYVLKLADRVVATINMSGIPNYIYEWLGENSQ